VGAKDKNIPAQRADEFGIGSAWTWVAIDADTKLICSWLVGKRDPGCATEFVQDLPGRLANRVQLTTDGLKIYLTAVQDGFGEDIDYAVLVKVYGNDPEGEKRYSPAVCTGCRKQNKIGDPDPKHISASYVERQNLTMRMGVRRFTRLTNAFSKKLENHVAAIALHYMHYNFCRIHQSLRVTPAMEAGVSDHVWSMAELVQLLNNAKNTDL
jgi:IS1 family transposase